MQKPSLPLWPRLLAALCIGTGSLCITPPAHAAEDLPKPHNLHKDAEDELKDYISDSRSTLSRLSELVKSDSYISVQDEWLSKSRVMIAKLEGKYKRALEKQAAQKLPPPIPPVKKWYDQELANWKNTETIGVKLVGMRDNLRDRTKLINDKFMLEMKLDREDAKKKADKITSWLEKGVGAIGTLKSLLKGNLPNPNEPDPYAGPLQIINQLPRELNPVAAGVEKVLVRREGVIVDFVKEVAKSDYEDNLSSLISQKIDIDQSGEFYKHEKQWEESLKSWLSKFNSAYYTYKEEAKPFLEHFIVAYINAKSSDIAQWFRFSKSDKTEKFDEAVLVTIKDMTEEAEEIVEKIKARKE